ASTRGEVTIAWDTYRNGSYDVYFRTLGAGGPASQPGPERVAAATARYESYPSIAYDGSGRLWLAWEGSGEGWGKDFGAYETSGIGLYQGRSVRMLVVDGDRFFTPPDPGAVMPGPPGRPVEPANRQSEGGRAMQPNPKLARERAASRVPT